MNGDTPETGRLMVVESDIRRHDEELKEHGRRLQAVELYTNGIPRIEKTLSDVLEQLKKLNDCQIISETEAKAKGVDFWNTTWGNRLWDLIRAAALVIITLLYAMNQHLIGAVK